jgi:dihydrofolate reductase
MAGKVFFSVSMSLDGFSAPESMDGFLATPEQREQDPRLERGGWRSGWSCSRGSSRSASSGRTSGWATAARRVVTTTSSGRSSSAPAQASWASACSTSASRCGRRRRPSTPPVFVVTHERRDPWARPGGTTFHFVNDGIESALDHARQAAGERDVRIAGGGETIVQYLNAGLIDEFTIALSPVLFGAGTRLFEGVDASRVALEPVRSEASSRVTHLTYAVHPK